MLLFQGDIMLEGSLVSWKRGARSHKGLKRTARNSVWGSSSLQASAVSSLFKGPAKKDLRRTQSFGGGRTRSSWTQTITAQPRARSKDERPESVPAPKPKEEEVPEDVAPEEAPVATVQESGMEPPLELTEAIPGVVGQSGEEAVQLSGFVGDSRCLNGTFTANGTEVNGKQVYSQGDGSKECMWYHNGAWRIGSYNWLDTKDLGRCHAFVKTEHDLDHIAASETWMSCLGSSGGDPDSQDGSLFQPQMSARAAKMALDNVVKRTGSKKGLVPSLSSNRLTNILTDQSLRHDIEPPPMTPPKRSNTWSRGSKDEANLSQDAKE